MKKRLVLIGLVAVLALSLVVYAISISGLPDGGSEQTLIDTDTMVDSGMPVPSMEGVEETSVSSGMPVPGLDSVDEMIVENE